MWPFANNHPSPPYLALRQLGRFLPTLQHRFYSPVTIQRQSTTCSIIVSANNAPWSGENQSKQPDLTGSSLAPGPILPKQRVHLPDRAMRKQKNRLQNKHSRQTPNPPPHSSKYHAKSETMFLSLPSPPTKIPPYPTISRPECLTAFKEAFPTIARPTTATSARTQHCFVHVASSTMRLLSYLCPSILTFSATPTFPSGASPIQCPPSPPPTSSK